MDRVRKFIKVFKCDQKDFDNLGYVTSRYMDGDLSEDVENCLKAVHCTFKICNIPVKEDSSKIDPRCIQAFKFLLLNAAFKCIDDLAKDPKNGSFVRIPTRGCPNMTLYSLMEVVAFLEYEQILAESLLHIPVDACIEILETLQANIFLWDFERAFDLVLAIILNCYKIMSSAWQNACMDNKQRVSESRDFSDMVTCTNKFLEFLTSPKFLRLDEVKGMEKSERIGYILKKIMALTYKCLSGKLTESSLSPEIAENYKLVFGTDPIPKKVGNLTPTLLKFNRDVTIILQKTIEEINFECYDDWASLEDDGNASITLQRSIRNDLYNFMDFLKDYKSFMYYKRLMELMQRYNPLPVHIVHTPLNLDGLRYGTIEMKLKAIKKMIHRYDEWDHNTFDLIKSNRYLFDSDDIPYMIDYLELIMRKPCQEYHKARVFVTIRKMLFKQHGFDNWATEVNAAWDEEREDNGYNESGYPDNMKCLDAAYSESNFTNFISRNEDLKSSENLRTMLLYLLYNPRLVLRTIIQVIIGFPYYAHLSIPPEDLIFFYPMTKLGGELMRLLLSEICTVIMNSQIWDAKKFADFINLMLTEFKFTANDFAKHVFQHWIYMKPTDVSSFLSTLKFMQVSIIKKCGPGLSIHHITQSIVERLAEFRRCIFLSRSVITEIILEIERTAQLFFEAYIEESYDRVYWEILEPIDKFKFPFLLLSPTAPDIRHECWLGIERARTRVKRRIPVNPDAPTKAEDFNHLKDDLARYKLIRSTEIEFVQIAEDLAEFEMMDFDLCHDYAAFNSIPRLFIETAIYFLEFRGINPPESFACLIRGFAQYLEKVMTHAVHKFNTWRTVSPSQNTGRLRRMFDYYKLVRNELRALKKTVKNSNFYPLYKSLMTTVNDPALDVKPRGVALCEIRSALLKFGNDCIKIPYNEVRYDRGPSAKALRFKRTHDFIHECLKITEETTDDASQYLALCATFKFLRN